MFELFSDYSALRLYSGAADNARICRPGIAGFYIRSLTDTTSADNGAIIVVDALSRRWLRVEKDIIKIEWFGAVGDWPTDGTNNTSAIQTAMTYIEHAYGTLYLGDGYFACDEITLGDPATANYRGASGQGVGIYALRGNDRLRSVFVANAGVGTLIKRNNLAGVSLENFGLHGQGTASVGMDLSWILISNAPTNQNILRDVAIDGFTDVGIILNNFYDSTVDGLRINVSVAVVMRGGGGSMRGSNWATGGVVKVCAQDFTFTDCELLGGLIISGNTNNNISFTGGQIFPIGTGGPGNGCPDTDGYIDPASLGYAIDASDSGSAGINLIVKNAFVFGAKNSSCVRGKFYLGATFENVTFNWDQTKTWAGEITTGASTKPVFYFIQCQFLVPHSPYENPSPDFDFVMVNCMLADSRRINYDSRTFSYLPTLGWGASGGPDGYIYQNGSYVISGREVTVYFDVQITSISTPTNDIVVLKNLPFPVNSTGLGSVSISILQFINFNSGYTELMIQPQANTTTAALFQSGSGQPLAGISSSALGGNARIAGSVKYLF